MTTIDVVGVLIAALSGAAVGIERQWSGHAAGPEARFAGIRTFTMLGGVGGLTGSLWSLGLTGPAIVVAAGAAGLVIAAYARASRLSVDGTTEVAALVVLTAGILAGSGAHRLASGTIALTCLLLVEKSRLHALVARIDDVGLLAGVRFGVMALVVLPLLPEGPFGPFGGLRPRELWALVLFFAGLNFLGYVARRLFGKSQGYLVAGLLGGLVSSTNVTFTFARASRTDQASARALAIGAVAANAVLYPRVLVAVAVLNTALLPFVARYLAVPALAAIALVVGGIRRSDTTATEPEIAGNPLQLKTALQMAVSFQAMLMLVHLAEAAWGTVGVYTTAAIMGLTDVDALTVSMARGVAGGGSLRTAAIAIAIGVIANTAVKLTLALLFGNRRFQAIVGAGLALMMVGTTVALVLL
ncbi:MAG TPA: MgtC/SapB family protein [Vicinamibacterales bacterium]|nr:MgtC/SapB family protein [Vicinamibacterales bacterium]